MPRRSPPRSRPAAPADSPGFLLGRSLPDEHAPIGFAARRTPPPPSEAIHYAGDGPLMTIAATGSGKSSGPVITNLLLHPGQGHCQVVEVTATLGRAARRCTGSRCDPDASLLAPDPEGLGAGTAVLGGRHQVPPRAEVAVDHGVRRQEALRLPG
jgi:hypothetical protein